MKRFICFILVMLLGCGFPLQASKPEIREGVQPVTIIGGGVGALTSAIYLQRAGIDTLVLEGSNPGGAIAQSPLVHNWPGETEINGMELVEKIRNQASFNGAEIVSQEVIDVDFSKRPFTITTRDVLNHDKIRIFKTNACIIATGSIPKLLGVPGESGEKGYWTRGVYSCAVCDGTLYRDKTVAVIGGGDSAITEANYLANIAKKVYIVIRSDKFRSVETLRKNELIKKPNVEILYNTKISEIQGDGKKVTHLNLSTNKQLPIDGVFVAIGATPNSSIFDGQLELKENGYIATKNGLETSVPGVYAIGDVADEIYKQAITAAGDGARAAILIENYLPSEQRKATVLPFQPQLTEKSKSIIVPVQNEISGSNFPEIKSKEEFYNIISSGQVPTLIEFYSPECTTCVGLMPKFREIADTYKGKIQFFRINVSEFSDLAGSYNVHKVPTVLIFDNQGKMLKHATGLDGINKTFKKLDSLTSK